MKYLTLASLGAVALSAACTINMPPPTPLTDPVPPTGAVHPLQRPLVDPVPPTGDINPLQRPMIDPVPPPECKSERFQPYIGAKSPQITVPAGTVIRHFRTGEPAPFDRDMSRLNFEYDRAGVLVSVTCG